MDDNNTLFGNKGSDTEEITNNSHCCDKASEDDDIIYFVNSYRVKEEHIKEFYLRSLLSPVFITGCVISFIVVIGVVLWTLFVGFDAMWTFVGAVWLFYPLFRIYTCFRSISLYKLRLKESYGGELPPQEYCFLDDCVVNGKDENQRLSYEDIKKVILTKNLILLRTGSKLNHIIPRDSFMKGTEKEFLDFMRSKGIKVKGK